MKRFYNLLAIALLSCAAVSCEKSMAPDFFIQNLKLVQGQRQKSRIMKEETALTKSKTTRSSRHPSRMYPHSLLMRMVPPTAICVR